MDSDRWRASTVSILVVTGALVSARSAVATAAEDLAAMRKGCEAGKADDCNNLAIQYEASRDPREKESAASFLKEAVRLYQQACDRGDDVGCGKLGWMYHTGRGVPEDLDRAVALYRGPCDRGNVGPCLSLGLALEQKAKSGRPSDLLASVAAYERACELGDSHESSSISCAKLANLHDGGSPDQVPRAVRAVVPRDLARAAVFHQCVFR